MEDKKESQLKNKQQHKWSDKIRSKGEKKCANVASKMVPVLPERF